MTRSADREATGSPGAARRGVAIVLAGVAATYLVSIGVGELPEPEVDAAMPLLAGAALAAGLVGVLLGRVAWGVYAFAVAAMALVLVIALAETCDDVVDLLPLHIGPLVGALAGVGLLSRRPVRQVFRPLPVALFVGAAIATLVVHESIPGHSRGFMAGGRLHYEAHPWSFVRTIASGVFLLAGAWLTVSATRRSRAPQRLDGD